MKKMTSVIGRISLNLCLLKWVSSTTDSEKILAENLTTVCFNCVFMARDTFKRTLKAVKINLVGKKQKVSKEKKLTYFDQ